MQRRKVQIDLSNYFVKRIYGKRVSRFIVLNHYSQRVPQIQYTFGLFSQRNEDDLLGVITYGLPPSPFTKIPFDFLELNRVAMKDNHKNIVSWFMARTFELLPKPLLLISFADTKMGHVGYIYQATNWIYTGFSHIKSEYLQGGRSVHDRNIKRDQSFKEIEGFAKHRYFLPLGSKTQKRQMKKWLGVEYEIQQYPKGDSQRYEMKDEVSKRNTLLNRKTLFNKKNENK